jgi:4'-phosphopantetheinyl transferase
MNAEIPQLRKGIIHIWYSPIHPWRNLVEDLRKLLSREEILRSENLVFSERQEDYIICRGLLRKILSQYLNQAPHQIPIEVNTKGKPYLSHHHYNFNLSHSKNLFLCGITQDSRIGVDLQHIYQISNLDSLVQKYLSPPEQQILKEAPENQTRELFFMIWTAKEAYLKGIGDGFHRLARSITVCKKDNGLLALRIKDGMISNHSDEWSIQEIRISPGYKASLAVEGDIVHIKYKSILPK